MLRTGIKTAIVASLFWGGFSVSHAEFKSTKQAMNEIFTSFVDLIPYASNEMRFKDPKAEEFIKSRLLKLTSAFKEAKHLKKISTPGFQPSFEVVSEHLDQTLETFTTQNKMFARTRLKATAQLCISCHTQLPNGASSTFRHFDSVKKNQFYNDFEYADYLFLIRNYTGAVRYYKEEIRKRIEKNKALKALHSSKTSYYIDYTIEKSLNRLVTIYTKVFYRPSKAISLLTPYLKNEDIPQNLRNDLKDWISDLKKWDARKFLGKVNNDRELKSFIKEDLNEDSPSDVTLLVAAGVLYKYINSHPNSQLVPLSLYWLGKIDNKLEHSYFFSLSEIYLKNCVKKYSSSPYAKQCYQQYKENLEMGFTGTAGTDIPEEELAKLKELKSYLK